MIEINRVKPRFDFVSAVLRKSLPLAALLLAGCSPDRVSESVTELDELIRLDIPIQAASWEVFYMPEAGGLPAPTEYIFLLAEVEPADPGWFASRPSHWTKAYALPEAAREWMSKPVRKQVEALTRQSQDQAVPTNCKDLPAKMTRSDRRVAGFTCTVGAKLLVHVLLQDNTGASSAEGSE
jgi:hypothetical protein